MLLRGQVYLKAFSFTKHSTRRIQSIIENSKEESAQQVLIIDEDEDFFFVNKPSQVSLETNKEFHLLIKQFGKRRYNFEPKVLFPLEKISSGITVFGKTATAERHFYKSYAKHGCVIRNLNFQ